MQDLGYTLLFERYFRFDTIWINEIVFDESNDVSLFCTVHFFGTRYKATLWCEFDQLNTIMLACGARGKEIAASLAGILDIGEYPNSLDLDRTYGQPLEVNQFYLHTSIEDFNAEDMSEEDFDGEDFLKSLQEEEDDEDDDEEDENAFLKDIQNDDEDESRFNYDDDLGEMFAFVLDRLEPKGREN